MKTKISFFSVIAFFLFCNGSCEPDKDRGLLIQNNSDMEITFIHARFTYEERPDLSPCIYVHDDYYRDGVIKPYSGKYFRELGKGISRFSPQDTAYIYVYNWIDVDTMTCEEFTEKFPIKKMWALTKKDAEAMDWTLTYP